MNETSTGSEDSNMSQEIKSFESVVAHCACAALLVIAFGIFSSGCDKDRPSVPESNLITDETMWAFDRNTGVERTEKSDYQ